MHMKHRGDVAESLAKSWLQHKGYRLITQNYTRRVGEIDLIFQHPVDDCIIFVEVRYRSGQRHGGGVESVDWKKQRKLVRAAQAWLQGHVNSRTRARIDVIAVQPARPDTPAEQYWHAHEITWVPNAIEG